jgi:hypothetical protein
VERDVGDIPPERRAEENPQGADPDTEGGEPQESPMDTGMPPGVHPNSEDPDPEVVEKAERQAAERDRRFGED